MDFLNHICDECHRGRYKETGFFDDMDGLLHCDICGSEVVRHPNYSDEEKLEIARKAIETVIPLGGCLGDWAKDLLERIK